MPPSALSPPRCFDDADCRFACFTAPYSLSRHLSRIAIASLYAGACDCSMHGSFAGNVDYTSGSLVLAAETAGGDVLHARMLRLLNQIA
eukprot:1356324-Rhodomonas_salina.1